MKGWKTWVTAMASVAWGAVGIWAGVHDASTGMGFIVFGLSLVGLGHKIEKAAEALGIDVITAADKEPVE